MGSSQRLASSQARSDSAMSNDISISEPPLRSAIAIVMCTRTVARLADGSPLMSSEAVRARGSDATIRPLPLYSDLKGPSPNAILASNEPRPPSLVRVAPGTQLSSVSGSCSSRKIQSGSRRTNVTALKERVVTINRCRPCCRRRR